MAKVLRLLSASLPSTFNPSSQLLRTNPIHESWNNGTVLSPDHINSCLRLMALRSPEKTTPLAINCRHLKDRWSIRGIRIGNAPQSWESTNIILVSGQRSMERSTIGVNLSVAASVLEQTQSNISVTVVPVMDPREYARVWIRENAVGMSAPADPSRNAVHLSSAPENLDVSEGFLSHYIRRLGSAFTSLELNFTSHGASLRHKKDSTFSRPPVDPASVFDFPHLRQRDNDNIISLPFSLRRAEPLASTYVIELRDRDNNVEADQVDERAEQVVSSLRGFLEEQKRRRGQ